MDHVATKKKTDDTADAEPTALVSVTATIDQLHVELIDPSPYQNRKAFGGREDDELAESVRVHGIIAPLQVRVRKPGRYELVFGERRWRAAKQIKLATVPAQVVALTDDQASERLLVENLQRRDLTALEEAEGFQRLLDKHEHTMDSLVAKTGKSKAHLYGRLKLLELAPGPKKALASGALPPMQAELIARIGDAKLQEQCTRIVLGKLDHDADQDLVDELEDEIKHETVGEEGARRSFAGNESILSFRATKALIRRKFTTKLALAKFDPTDAVLTSAGACTMCPHRSGNQPELPGVFDPKTDDLCTLASCFAAKTEAQWKRTAAAAKERGLEILAKEDAAKVFAYDGVKVNESAPYVELTTELPYDLQKSPGSKATWGKLLGKLAGDVPHVLVQDESGAPRELIDAAAAKKLLLDAGKIDKPTKPGTTHNDEYKQQQKSDKAKRELHGAALQRVLEQVHAGAVKDPGAKELAQWRWITTAILGDFGNDDVAHQRGLDGGEELRELVEKAKSVGELRALVAEFLVAEMYSIHLGPKDKARFLDGLKLFGADWDKALELAKAATKAEAKVDAKKKGEAKAPAKKGGAK